MDEVKDWLINLSIGDAYPVRDYGYKETARLANKCLALLKEQEKQINELEHNLSVAENNLNFYINGND